jgi:serine/threonine protein kinase
MGNRALSGLHMTNMKDLPKEEFFRNLRRNHDRQETFLLDMLVHMDYRLIQDLDLSLAFHALSSLVLASNGCVLTPLAKSKGGDVYLLTHTNSSTNEKKQYVQKTLGYNNAIKVKEAKQDLKNACFQDEATCFRLLGSNGFVNEYLVGVIVKTCLENNNLGFWAMKYYGAFIEGDKGNILMEKVTGDCSTIPNITPKTIVSLLLQLCSGLDCLKRHAMFSHNDLKLKNLFFKHRKKQPKGWPSQIPWDNIVIKFADFDKSSCVLSESGQPGNINNNKLFIYPVGNKLAENAPQCFFAKKTVNKQKMYTISNKVMHQETIALNCRHSGGPFYKSFDLYVFLVSLLLNKKFAKVLLNNSELYSACYDPLIKNDTKFKNKIVEKLKFETDETRNSVNTAFDVLNGVNLPCNGIQSLHETLTNYACNAGWTASVKKQSV